MIQTNEPVSDKGKHELLPIKIGSKWKSDSIYFLLLAPISFIGVILNLITLCKLHDRRTLQTCFFVYMKAFVWISWIRCLVVFIFAFNQSERYFVFDFELRLKTIYLFNKNKSSSILC